MARGLKVFRTAIGFHDAYVAAPSRKAALAAWGADADLFARGVAEEVTDATLTAAPLAEPGKVLRVMRGTADEHFAALPAAKPRSTLKASPKAARTAKPEPAARSRKPPSRARLDAAEAAVDNARTTFRDKAAALDEREAELRRERRTLETAHEANLATLEKKRNAARDAYDRALDQT